MKKTCTHCNETKDITEFSKEKGSKDGYRNQCKKCRNARRPKKRPIPKEGYKYCANCHEEKSLNNFRVTTIKGKRRPWSYCHDCDRERDSMRYAHTCEVCKKEYRSGRKNSRMCFDCHTELMKTDKNPTAFKYVVYSGRKNGMYGVRRWGKDNPNYKPDKSDEEREKQRLVDGYVLWRKSVFERDNYTCQVCKDFRGGNLIAHHLNSWDWCREERLDKDNGITLCRTCHKLFHDTYGYGNNTKQQFVEYTKDTVPSL